MVSMNVEITIVINMTIIIIVVFGIIFLATCSRL